MVGKTASTNENHKLYNSTVQAISWWGGDCATKVGSLCDRFFDIEPQVQNQVENGLCKLLNFWGQTMDVSYQAFFTLKYSGDNDK